MKKEFNKVVEFLESLSIMPKEMPGIDKLKSALEETNWYSRIDPKKVIVIAGTNGKGSTCAILESLLVSAGKKVGFYSSPHLIDTTERIRCFKSSISKDDFIKLFFENQKKIEKYQLTHFEALTLMAADYFFSDFWNHQLDYAIFEVGLGGLFDATNAIPHATSVVTALGLDHTNILGSDLLSIAKNKFGIIQKNNLVIHHALSAELISLKNEIMKKTNSQWIAATEFSVEIKAGPKYFLITKWGKAALNLLGYRAAENAATALTVFHALGYQPKKHLTALREVEWLGRMQKVKWPGMKASLYLSGDHNLQGIKSLIQLLADFSYENLFILVGIGKDKDADVMLSELVNLKNSKLYITETPFKGLRISEYPQYFLDLAEGKNESIFVLFKEIEQKAGPNDMVLVTGSLYLVGDILKFLETDPTQIANSGRCF